MSNAIRLQADDFLDAYNILAANYETTLTIMTPSVVNLAFAVELYIKDLHYKLHGKAPRGHNILKLYMSLPRQIRREIFNHHTICENSFITRGSAILIRRFKGVAREYYGFIQSLNTISNSFAKWRYSYESKVLNYDSSLALAFIEAVKTVSNRVPEDKTH